MQYNLRDTSSEEGNVSEEEVSGKVEPKCASLTDLEKAAPAPRREVSRFKAVQLGLTLSASPAEGAARICCAVLTGECA